MKDKTVYLGRIIVGYILFSSDNVGYNAYVAAAEPMTFTRLNVDSVREEQALNLIKSYLPEQVSELLRLEEV